LLSTSADGGGGENVFQAAMHRRWQQAGGERGRDFRVYVCFGSAGARFGRHSCALAGCVAGAYGSCLPGLEEAMSQRPSVAALVPSEVGTHCWPLGVPRVAAALDDIIAASGCRSGGPEFALVGMAALLFVAFLLAESPRTAACNKPSSQFSHGLVLGAGERHVLVPCPSLQP